MLDASTISYLRTKCITKISKKPNDYFYPKTLPKERGPMVKITLAIFLIIAIIVYAYLDPNDILRGFAEASAYILFFLFLEIAYRFLLIIEEIKHITSRYDNDYIKLFRELFTFSNTFKVLLSFCTITVLISGINLTTTLQLRTLCVGTILYLIGKFSLSSAYIMGITQISRKSGYDYGSGMAYSYFYGYLKLVLDKGNEGESKNFLELQEEYENRHKVKFAMNKLIILIPRSCHCPRSLKNDFSPLILESPNSLPEKIITVSGVKDRVYKNAVYKIAEGLERSTEKKIYVCAEYATPLKTFYDVVQEQSEHSGLFRKLMNDITLMFYLRLRSILEEKGLIRFCELIYFDDKDEFGEYLDVGQIILLRIKELVRLEKSKWK